MIKMIQEIIQSFPEITDYKIQYTTSTTYELFFVLKELETSRATDSTDCLVTIYTTVNHQRGCSTITVHSYDPKEEIENNLKEAVETANQALNPYYELVEPASFENQNTENVDFPALAHTMVENTFAVDDFDQGWINSSEFFLTQKHIHLVTSKGIDYEYNHFEIMIEVIPTWQAKEEEVELLEVYQSSFIDPAAIQEEIREAFENVKNRSIARVIENKNVPVILQKKEVGRIFNSFANEANYKQFYDHTNLYNVGDSMQEGATGDLITIDLIPELKDSISSSPIDSDGIVLKQKNIIQNGNLVSMWGNNQYGQYLKEIPTGSLNNILVKEGSVSYEQMTSSPVLLVVNMSGLQIERYSGYIGGEVRLGYYIDGNKMIPVTSLSISGNLNEAKKDFTFSKEIYATRGYQGPKYIKMKGFKIN